MYQLLTFLHTSLRWLVLLSLIIATLKAYRGYSHKKEFKPGDNTIRHWTATIAHIQLMIGITLYFQSPLIKYFLHHFNEAKKNLDLVFFGLIHSTLMFTAIVLVTIGSALSKRMQTDREKFRTMLIWYAVALLIIFIAIPWPFSPLAKRPFFR